MCTPCQVANLELFKFYSFNHLWSAPCQRPSLGIWRRRWGRHAAVTRPQQKHPLQQERTSVLSAGGRGEGGRIYWEDTASCQPVVLKPGDWKNSGQKLRPPNAWWPQGHRALEHSRVCFSHRLKPHRLHLPFGDHPVPGKPMGSFAWARTYWRLNRGICLEWA